MNLKRLNNDIFTDDVLKNIIKDTVYSAVQATKSENSGLVGDLRREIAVMKERDDIHYKEITDTLAEIKSNVIRHNGRMTKIEQTDSYNKGAQVILGIVASVAVTVSGWALLKITDLDKLISNHVSATVNTQSK